MNSTENWWRGEIDWNTPAWRLLEKLLKQLPTNRHFSFTIYDSALLQMTIDRTLLSGDVDIFSNDDDDVSTMIREQKLDSNESGGLYLEAGYQLSFRTTAIWRQRAKPVRFSENVELLFPHPLDILIGKLNRLDPKDLTAFERVIAITGHPTAEELKRELQNAVDLFRPNFDEEAPNCFPENTERLWREIFKSQIDVRQEIIQPAIARRKQGYGEEPPDYKSILREP
jgi:hypothetical protein